MKNKKYKRIISKLFISSAILLPTIASACTSNDNGNYGSKKPINNPKNDENKNALKVNTITVDNVTDNSAAIELYFSATLHKNDQLKIALKDLKTSKIRNIVQNVNINSNHVRVSIDGLSPNTTYKIDNLLQNNNKIGFLNTVDNRSLSFTTLNQESNGSEDKNGNNQQGKNGDGDDKKGSENPQNPHSGNMPDKEHEESKEQNPGSENQNPNNHQKIDINATVSSVSYQNQFNVLLKLDSDQDLANKFAQITVNPIDSNNQVINQDITSNIVTINDKNPSFSFNNLDFNSKYRIKSIDFFEQGSENQLSKLDNISINNYPEFNTPSLNINVTFNDNLSQNQDSYVLGFNTNSDFNGYIELKVVKSSDQNQEYRSLRSSLKHKQISFLNLDPNTTYIIKGVSLYSDAGSSNPLNVNMTFQNNKTFTTPNQKIQSNALLEPKYSAIKQNNIPVVYDLQNTATSKTSDQLTLDSIKSNNTNHSDYFTQKETSENKQNNSTFAQLKSYIYDSTHQKYRLNFLVPNSFAKAYTLKIRKNNVEESISATSMKYDHYLYEIPYDHSATIDLIGLIDDNNQSIKTFNSSFGIHPYTFNFDTTVDANIRSISIQPKTGNNIDVFVKVRKKTYPDRLAYLNNTKLKVWRNNNIVEVTATRRIDDYHATILAGDQIVSFVYNTSTTTQIHDLPLTEINFDSSKNTYDINSITVDQNAQKVNVTLNSNVTNANNLSFIVKGIDHNIPFIRTITPTINNNIASFDINQLSNANISYVITNILLNDGFIDLSEDKKYQFNITTIENNNLSYFNYYMDQNTKKVYASAFFNFNSHNLKYLKNMYFDFMFEKETQNYDNQLVLGFEPTKHIMVRFDDLWKFELPNFNEYIKYTLKKVRIVKPVTYKQLATIDVAANLQKTLAYHFNYASVDQNNFSANGIERRTTNDFSRYDLRKKWLANYANDTVDFSLYNLWSVSEYLSDYTFIKDREFLNQAYPNPIVYKFNKNSETKKIQLFGPREQVKAKLFNIDNSNKTASLTKKLSNFKNLDQIPENESLMMFDFEFELHDRTNYDLYYAYTINSTVRLPFNLTKLKQTGKLENLNFYFYQIFTSQAVQEHNYNKINAKFSFNLYYDSSNNTITLKVISKDKDYNFTQDIATHNIGLEKNVFIGPARIAVIHTNENVKIEYNSDKVDALSNFNPKISYLNENINKNYDFSFSPGMSVDDIKTWQSKRLFKEDKSGAADLMRQRAFRISVGTWNLIGKVKPDDDNDYRFYVMTNHHVAVHVPVPNTPTSFYIPTLLDRPAAGTYQTGPSVQDGKLTKIYAFENYKYNYQLIKDYYNIGSFIDNEGRYQENNIAANQDLVIATIDLRSIFEQYQGVDLSKIQMDAQTKESIKYILNWKNLAPTKLSNEVKYLQDFDALNWYVASFPGERTIGPETVKSIRYREYILMYMPYFMNDLDYEQTRYKSTKISFNRVGIDLAGGASGSGVYDEKGNVVGLITEGWNSFDGAISAHLFAGQVRNVFGSKDNKINQDSFYEYIKHNSFLYPKKYTDIYWDDDITIKNNQKTN
ncbi:hypothetical protein ACXYRQ_00110 [Mycoplasma sp. 394]